MWVEGVVQVEAHLIHPVVLESVSLQVPKSVDGIMWGCYVVFNIKILANFDNEHPAKTPTSTIDHLRAQVPLHVSMHCAEDPLARQRDGRTRNMRGKVRAHIFPPVGKDGMGRGGEEWHFQAAEGVQDSFSQVASHRTGLITHRRKDQFEQSKSG